MRTGILALVVLIFGFTSGATAKDAPCAPEVTTRSVRLHYQGNPGLWFDADVAQCLLADIEAGRAREAVIEAMARREAAQTVVLDLTERQLELAVQEADTARAALHVAVEQRLEAERMLTRPGRSRALWFALGVISGVVVVGAAAYAVSATQ